MPIRSACWFAIPFVTLTCYLATSADEPSKGSARYAIAIHGGTRGSVENMSEEERTGQLESLKKALDIGKAVLESGGDSLDAVEKTIRFLEDDPRFNAGRGAVFNSAGGHELDASIMDGRDRSCGAVASVRTVKNPIGLARLVMTETRHVLLAAAGAERFADEMEVDRVEQKYFWTEKRFEARKRAQQKQKSEEDGGWMGTVGCVALDRHGNLAAGTSTGGLTNKKFGRIGDSPIIGAGTYADNGTCAVSCTGIGEHFIRHAVAYDVSALMKYKQLSLADAAAHVIHQTLKPGDGGVIAVARDGSIVMDFNTPGMARGAADSTGRFEVKLGK